VRSLEFSQDAKPLFIINQTASEKKHENQGSTPGFVNQPLWGEVPHSNKGSSIKGEQALQTWYEV
jgi:hypothetical protein